MEAYLVVTQVELMNVEVAVKEYMCTRRMKYGDGLMKTEIEYASGTMDDCRGINS